MNTQWGSCKAETFRETWHEIIILCSAVNIPVKFQSTKITVSKKDDALKTTSQLSGEFNINTVNK